MYKEHEKFSDLAMFTLECHLSNNLLVFENPNPYPRVLYRPITVQAGAGVLVVAALP